MHHVIHRGAAAQHLPKPQRLRPLCNARMRSQYAGVCPISIRKLIRQMLHSQATAEQPHCRYARQGMGGSGLLGIPYGRLAAIGRYAVNTHARLLHGALQPITPLASTQIFTGARC